MGRQRAPRFQLPDSCSQWGGACEGCSGAGPGLADQAAINPDSVLQPRPQTGHVPLRRQVVSGHQQTCSGCPWQQTCSGCPWHRCGLACCQMQVGAEGKAAQAAETPAAPRDRGDLGVPRQPPATGSQGLILKCRFPTPPGRLGQSPGFSVSVASQRPTCGRCLPCCLQGPGQPQGLGPRPFCRGPFLVLLAPGS